MNGTYQSANVWAPGTKIVYLVNANSTLIWQRVTAGIAQTRFNVTTFQYVPNVGSLLVFINGVLQQSGLDYVEDASGTFFTFMEAPLIGDLVDIGGFIGITGSGSGGGSGFVTSYAGRVGAIVPQYSDLTTAALFSSDNAWAGHNAFSVSPTVPTLSPGDATTKIASTAFVTAAVVASTTGVASFNTRTGAVVLTSMDVTTALGFTPGTGSNYYESVKDYGAVGNGSTDDSAAILAAIAASVTSKKLVYFPPGTYLTDAFSVSSGCPGLLGAGMYTSTIKFKDQVYSANTNLISAINSTVGMLIANFTVLTDAANFFTSATRSLTLSGTHRAQVQNVRFKGRGQYGIYASTGTSYSVLDHIVFEATGGNNTWDSACFIVSSVSWRITRVISVGDSGGSIGNFIVLSGATYTNIVNCYCDGTNTGVGFKIINGVYMVLACNNISFTGAEGVLLQDCVGCIVSDNTMVWDGGANLGLGYGISLICTAPNSCYQNKVHNNNLQGSYAAGIVIINGCTDNVVSDNHLVDCGRRGSVSGTYSQITSLCQITTAAGASPANNTFKDNRIANIVGTTHYGYAEFNNGAGASITLTDLIDNEIQTGSTSVAKYLLVDETSSLVESAALFTYVPIVTSSAGAITTYVVNAATYKRKGREVQVICDISITNNGTGSGAVLVTLPLNAGSATGVVTGREFTGGTSLNGLIGTVASNIAAVHNYDNSYPGTTGNRLVLQFSYYML